jgi:hypothetical protein
MGCNQSLPDPKMDYSSRGEPRRTSRIIQEFMIKADAEAQPRSVDMTLRTLPEEGSLSSHNSEYGRMPALQIEAVQRGKLGSRPRLFARNY